MTSNSARKRAIRALQQRASLPYTEAASRVAKFAANCAAVLAHSACDVCRAEIGEPCVFVSNGVPVPGRELSIPHRERWNDWAVADRDRHALIVHDEDMAVHRFSVSPTPSGCYVVVGRDTAGREDELERHFGEYLEAVEYRDELARAGSLSEALTYRIEQRQQPCLLIECADCQEFAENEWAGQLHCTDPAECARFVRELGYFDDGEQVHCASCMEYPWLVPGQRVRFGDEKMTYTVRATAAESRFAALTRTIPGGRLQYTVIDWALGIRGADNAYARYGYSDDQAIYRSLRAFTDGEIEISYRHWEWLRFADGQPDTRTVGMLDQLRARAWRGFTERPERQNACYKTEPEPPIEDR